MEPPRKHKSSGVPVKEEVELEDGNDLLVKRRRNQVSGSIVQLQMEPPRKHKSSGVPVKEEVELEDGNDLLVKRRRTEVSGSIVQLQMEPPRKHKSSGVPVKEEVELKDGNDLLVKRKRTEVSGSIVQLQQQLEVFDMENKVADSLPIEYSTGKDPNNVLTSCAVQNSGQANGHSNESAISKLLNICKAIHWREPAYDFEEQGPPHMKTFKCKVTVHLDGLLNTILECFSEPKPKKKAAKEHATQGALWWLKQSGFVN